MNDEGADSKNPLAEVHGALEKMDKIGWGETFRFRCHKELSCWTACCHGASIFLTPYDVLRAKRRLGLRSDEFIAKHVHVTVGEDFGLPLARLKMDGPKGACPFVSEEGCSIYGDRPTTCRLYPIGQATSSGTEARRGERVYFKIYEDHCLGWKDPKTYKLEDWVIDQGATDYNFYNELIIQMTFHHKLGDPSGLDDQKMGMIFMALYDLDRFRQFVFDTTFLDRFDVEKETIEKIKTSDEELLRFGMRWIEFSVMGMKTMELKAT